MLYWNINGLTDSKAYLHDIYQQLSRFDIVLLTETRVDGLDSRALTGFSVALVPSSQPGQAGEGLLVAVKRSLHYTVMDWGSNNTSLWVKVQFQTGPPLVVGVCYFPPQGSPQLREIDLDTRMTSLSSDFLAADKEGYVLLGGDFNARVGGCGESSPHALGVRGCTDTTVNGYGRKLLQFCNRTGAFLCTGRVEGDRDGAPTYRATSRAGATRIDHMLASPVTLPLVSHSHVLTGWAGSDHYPIHTSVRVPITVGPVEPCLGQALPYLRWDPAARGQYAHALSTVSQPSLTAALAAADQGDVDNAFHHLEHGMLMAAEHAGMPCKVLRHKPMGRGPHKPFFDAECMALKRRVRALGRRGRTSVEYKTLERQYHSVVRAKRRAYRLRQLEEVLRQQMTNPRGFWRRLRSDPRPLPAPLCRVQVWNAYLQALSDCGNAPRAPLPADSHPSRPHPEAVRLSESITEGEVLDGLHHLHNGRASGLHGYPAELLRAAQPIPPPGEAPQPHVLAPVLVRVFNAALDAGRLPDSINHTLVTPVFKKGDVGDPANYRPIAVTEPISRLYATILNKRLVSFTEDCDLRDPTQAGFRPGKSTVHQIFALQHFVDAATPEQPLYCCFLDLKSAYDRVPKHALWEALRRLGIGGKGLGAFQSFHNNSTIGMKIDGRTGTREPSISGVKQGCPLSPTLFGLFVDGLFHYLRTCCPTDGVLLPDGDHLCQLGYADDFVLLSHTVAGLQHILDAASAWCDMTGMIISYDKSKVMAFAAGDSPLPQCHCGGHVLEWVQSYVYLGVLFDSQCGVRATFPRLHHKMWGAFALIQRQYGKLGCLPCVGLLLDVYKACVPPVGSYGCEVWGFLPAPADASRARALIATSHTQMLRLIAGVPATACADLLFKELSMRRLEYVWWKRTVRFWNNLASLPCASLHYRVALHNCRLAVAGGSRNWAFGVMMGLRRIGYTFTIRCDRLDPIDWSVVRSCLDRQAEGAWTGLHLSPRLCPSPRAQRCTYARWFAKPSCAARHSSVIRLPIGARLLRAFLRFRLGCHNLPVAVGRRTGVPRAQRLCPHCSLGDVGDERHLTFVCPAVQHVRDKYRQLFALGRPSMREFMWQDDIRAVVRFVVECLDVLEAPASASHQP